ncbi:hypothetical protein BJ508DRAFT_321013 [Ascobolus immersus RN42]|uniref:Uncharacterized protein n=1 Tax=Ascobolus immersus RN42 TaxID=1160509 RepID=A0A3N4ILX4_ASCIM|nr:hypothetical protein BJ508DRAFT_321013 [Ascobolus immersus RN42]
MSPSIFAYRGPVPKPAIPKPAIPTPRPAPSPDSRPLALCSKQRNKLKLACKQQSASEGSRRGNNYRQRGSSGSQAHPSPHISRPARYDLAPRTQPAVTTAGRVNPSTQDGREDGRGWDFGSCTETLPTRATKASASRQRKDRVSLALQTEVVVALPTTEMLADILGLRVDLAVPVEQGVIAPCDNCVVLLLEEKSDGNRIIGATNTNLKLYLEPKQTITSQMRILRAAVDVHTALVMNAVRIRKVLKFLCTSSFGITVKMTLQLKDVYWGILDPFFQRGQLYRTKDRVENKKAGKRPSDVVDPIWVELGGIRMPMMTPGDAIGFIIGAVCDPSGGGEL